MAKISKGIIAFIRASGDDGTLSIALKRGTIKDKTTSKVNTDIISLPDICPFLFIFY